MFSSDQLSIIDLKSLVAQVNCLWNGRQEWLSAPDSAPPPALSRSKRSSQNRHHEIHNPLLSEPRTHDDTFSKLHPGAKAIKHFFQWVENNPSNIREHPYQCHQHSTMRWESEKYECPYKTYGCVENNLTNIHMFCTDTCISHLLASWYYADGVDTYVHIWMFADVIWVGFLPPHFLS
jgi:hypothetical protein